MLHSVREFFAVTNGLATSIDTDLARYLGLTIGYLKGTTNVRNVILRYLQHHLAASLIEIGQPYYSCF